MAQRESISYSLCEEIIPIFSLFVFFSFLSTLISSALNDRREKRVASDFDYREALIDFNETTSAIKVKMETKS